MRGWAGWGFQGASLLVVRWVKVTITAGCAATCTCSVFVVLPGPTVVLPLLSTAFHAPQMFSLLGWPEGELQLKPEDASGPIDDLLAALLGRARVLQRAAEQHKEVDWALFKWVCEGWEGWAGA